MFGKESRSMNVSVAMPNGDPDKELELQYADGKIIGNGSFGVVYMAKIMNTSEHVAIKKVLQDKRFKASILIVILILVLFNYSLITEQRTTNHETSKSSERSKA